MGQPLSRATAARTTPHDQHNLCIEELYRRYGPLVRSVCHRVLGDHPEIPDLVQDVFVNVIESMPSYSSSRPFGPWIATIARRRAIDQVRRQNRVRGERPAGLAIDDGATTDPRSDVEAAIDAQRLLHSMAPSFRTLSPRERRVLVRLAVDGWTRQEIAEELDIGMVGIRTVIHRAREKLVRSLESQPA